jgi:hypothetical protein
MSSTRRTANEINILAMLDRHEAAGLPARLLRGLRASPATAWYGTAGALVCVLVGLLAWLAHDSDSFSVDSALAGAVTVGPAAPIAAAQPEPASASLSAPEPPADPEPAPAARAAIVDVAPAPAAEPAAPVQHAGRSPREVTRDPQRPAAHATAGKNNRTAAGKAPVSSHAAILPHAEPRHKRPAPLPKAAVVPVDTDVALISAIIQHANRREEAEDAARKP